MCGNSLGNKNGDHNEKVSIGFSSVLGTKLGELKDVYNQQEAQEIVDDLNQKDFNYDYFIINSYVKNCLGNCLNYGKNQSMGDLGGGNMLDKGDSLNFYYTVFSGK